MLISVIIPVYNAQQSLHELYEGISRALKGREYEIILVDDSSRDKSWEIISALAHGDSRVVALRHSFNMGQDHSLLTGLKHSKGDYCVIMDDDLQHSPDDIPLLLDACEGKADVCYADFTERHHAQWKITGSYINGLLARFLLAKPADLYLSPFKVISRKIVDMLIHNAGAFFYLDASLLIQKPHVVQIALKQQASRKTRSSYNFRNSLFVFANHLLGSARRLPQLFLLVVFLIIYLSLLILTFRSSFKGEEGTDLTAMGLFLLSVLVTSWLAGFFYRALRIYLDKKPQRALSLREDQ